MTMRVAIGSTNPVKVAAVQHVIRQAWPGAQFVSLAVDSGVSAMPRNDVEGIAGATTRARQALAQADADLGVGLEGALDDTPLAMYITNWVAIVDRLGGLGLGNGGKLPLPACIASELRAGGELGPIIDRYSGQRNSKQHQGAAGFLTSGIIPREMAFRLGVAFALAPFLHRDLYGIPPGAESF